MQLTHIHSEANTATIRALAARSIGPLFLFAAVLAGLLLLSFSLLLPLFTRVEVQGSLQSLSDLEELRSDLESKVMDASAKRESAVLPFHDARYAALANAADSDPDFSELRRALQNIADAIVDQPDAIHISSMTYDAPQKSLVIEGDVRFVGARSMTLLAQFVEELSKDPIFVEVTLPRFVREDGPTGPHSPFRIEAAYQ